MLGPITYLDAALIAVCFISGEVGVRYVLENPLEDRVSETVG